MSEKPVLPTGPVEGLTYIAGPMTGYPEWNYPAFAAMAERLRAAGHLVVSPAELSDPSGDVAWDWYLRRDLVELVKCERVVLLDGWTNSKGATLEHLVAQHLGLDIVYPHDHEELFA